MSPYWSVVTLSLTSAWSDHIYLCTIDIPLCFVYFWRGLKMLDSEEIFSRRCCHRNSESYLLHQLKKLALECFRTTHLVFPQEHPSCVIFCSYSRNLEPISLPIIVLQIAVRSSREVHLARSRMENGRADGPVIDLKAYAVAGKDCRRVGGRSRPRLPPTYHGIRVYVVERRHLGKIPRNITVARIT
jgi:hypothetical protein